MKYLHIKRFLLLAAFFIYLPVIGQDPEAIIGHVLDSKSGEPIVFATISIKGENLGVVSNLDGSFKIPTRVIQAGQELIIKCMGYQTRIMPIDGLSDSSDNIIQLDPGIIELSEAVISPGKEKKLSVRAIVRKAIRAIPKNYPDDPFALKGYYRDYQMEHNDYLNLNEAILEVLDYGFHTTDQDSTKVKIYDYRKNMKFKRDTVTQIPYDYENRQKVIENAYLRNYGGNEFTILRIHDAIRNFNIDSYSFVNRLESDLLNNHSFKREKETYFDDEALHTISFRKNYQEYSAHGTLYISKNDFAIFKLDYALYLNAQEGSSKKRGEGDIKREERQLIFKVTTEYGRRNTQLYLNYISFVNSFRIRYPAPFFVKYVTAGYPFFVVHFNHKFDPKTARQAENYVVKFKGEKIPCKVESRGNELIYLQPELDPIRLNSMFRDIVYMGNSSSLNPELLSVEVKDVYDREGNLIHKKTYKDFEQFREFFVQQVTNGHMASDAEIFLEMEQPIFQQPLNTARETLNSSWMNSPLQQKAE